MRRCASLVPTSMNCGVTVGILWSLQLMPLSAQRKSHVSVTRPTILQIIPRLDTGGAELSTIEITDAIVRAGGRALVLTDGGRMAGEITKAGGELVPFPAGTKNPARVIWNALAIAKIIRTAGVDLVHARSRAPAWSALIAARRTGTPFVTTYHGAYSEKGRVKNLYNSVMARSDAVIANSGYTAGLIRSRYDTPSDRITVIHRGVDGAAFDPAQIAPERVTALRTAWGLRPEQRAILQAARLTSWKGQAVLIAAAGMLKAGGQLGDAVIIFAGDDQGRTDYSDGLRAQIAALGLDGSVRLVGHVGDMPAALAAAHIAVIASTEPEAFGRSVTEAASMGTPAIATDLGAPPETMQAHPKVPLNDATGWIVPPSDATALARALTDALTMSPVLRAAMGQRARSRTLERFSLSQMKRQTLQVYDKLLLTKLVEAFDDQQQSQRISVILT
jgi:glycosyltransferase involved in cell wall biosynthesis